MQPLGKTTQPIPDEGDVCLQTRWTSKSIETSHQAAEQIATWLDQSDTPCSQAPARRHSRWRAGGFAYTGNAERLYGIAQRYSYDEYSRRLLSDSQEVGPGGPASSLEQAHAGTVRRIP